MATWPSTRGTPCCARGGWTVTWRSTRTRGCSSAKRACCCRPSWRTSARGWFLPVVPGTRHVTVGGAIANDVHGKNHHAMGSFGDQVGLRLLRTDGTVIECSPQENADWFSASVGGLGLTGPDHPRPLAPAPHQLGLDAGERAPLPRPGRLLRTECEAESRHEYAVSWIDCSLGRAGLRGVLLAGDHADEGPDARAPAFPAPPKRVSFPVTPAFFAGQPAELRLFNSAYFHKAPRHATFLQAAWDYFWPLDKIEHWNRIYGRRGLLQYQFVVPPHAAARGGLRSAAPVAAGGRRILPRGTQDLWRSPCAGHAFVRAWADAGARLPNVPRVHALFARLDACIARRRRALCCQGRPGSSALFHAAYPRWAEFQRYRDPGISLVLRRRMEVSL